MSNLAVSARRPNKAACSGVNLKRMPRDRVDVRATMIEALLAHGGDAEFTDGMAGRLADRH